MAKVAMDMPLDFAYHGINRRGRKVTGELSSRSMALAKAQLQKQGIMVTKIKRKPTPLFEVKKRIKTLDIAIFVRQLATMIKAGVPLVQSFEIVAESVDNRRMKLLILDIKSEVECGTPFASALRQHPQHFDNLCCSLIESGERSGTLETMLNRVAAYKEKSELLKAKIKKAVKYPIAVIIVAFIVTMILLIKVVPVFSDLFSSSGSELPAFTQLVVAISEWIRNWWYLLLMVLILTPIGFLHTKKHNQKFRHQLDRLVLKLPIIGTITYHAIVARFSRTLATTFAAGVPLIDALGSTAGATNNIVFYDAIQQVKEDVLSGQQLHFSMRSTALFPNMAIQLVSIGEESGSLDDMLEKVATYYENEVDNAIDGLTSLMEPVIMVILGIIIGGLVIAMYLPIFKMGSVIG